jgi:hypothetical protein
MFHHWTWTTCFDAEMEPLHVREISNDEADRLMTIVRQGNGSVTTWHRAQIVLWSAQGLEPPRIAPLAFTSEDRVAAVIHGFNDGGLESLHAH